MKEVDDQTAEMLRGIIRSLFEIAKVKVREGWPRRKSPGADSEIRRKKKAELTGLFRKTLRMPLQPKDRQLVMLKASGAAIIRAALNDLQVLT